MLQQTYSEVTVYSPKSGYWLAVGMGSNTGHTNTQDTVCVSHLQMLDLVVFPDKKTKTKA